MLGPLGLVFIKVLHGCPSYADLQAVQDANVASFLEYISNLVYPCHFNSSIFQKKYLFFLKAVTILR